MGVVANGKVVRESELSGGRECLHAHSERDREADMQTAAEQEISILQKTGKKKIAHITQTNETGHRVSALQENPIRAYRPCD